MSRKLDLPVWATPPKCSHLCNYSMIIYIYILYYIYTTNFAACICRMLLSNSSKTSGGALEGCSCIFFSILIRQFQSWHWQSEQPTMAACGGWSKSVRSRRTTSFRPWVLGNKAAGGMLSQRFALRVLEDKLQKHQTCSFGEIICITATTCTYKPY